VVGLKWRSIVVPVGRLPRDTQLVGAAFYACCTRLSFSRVVKDGKYEESIEQAAARNEMGSKKKAAVQDG
jgi:hypothetical protein